MSIFHNLKSWLSPTRRVDKDFGSLLYVHISHAPDGSYWEGEWEFPSTRTPVTICLPGDESGPTAESRDFYLALPMRFEQIVATCRPIVEKVFQEWLHQPLPEDLFTAVRLVGFSLEDTRESPFRWEISFETTGDKWLSIAIPFVGDSAAEPLVDT